MQSLIRRSLTKWLIFAFLGIIAFTTGYFLGQRQGEAYRLEDQPEAPQNQESVMPL